MWSPELLPTNLLVIVAHLMNLDPVQKAAWQMRRLPSSALVCVLLAVVAGAMGCEELTARRTLQEAAREYADGHFEKAAQECEKALAIMPDFDIANHNCALIYHKMFRPGLDTPGNAKIADREIGRASCRERV